MKLGSELREVADRIKTSGPIETSERVDFPRIRSSRFGYPMAYQGSGPWREVATEAIGCDGRFCSTDVLASFRGLA